jgi:hypothetical protein
LKSKILIPVLSLLLLASCKKETQPGIVGQWISSAYYRNTSGNFMWYSSANARFNEFITFDADNRFGTFSDVPGAGGHYIYDRAASQLILNYEADQYGNQPGSETYKVEKLDNNQFIIAYYYNTGELAGKTEYTRRD